jgi:hypothetical protein
MRSSEITTALVFDATKPLPEHLSGWLTTAQPHPVFATAEWFNALINFKRKEAHNNSDYYWLFVFSDAEPCIAAPIERNGDRLKLIANFYTPYIDIFYTQQTYSAGEAWSLLFPHLGKIAKRWLSLEIFPLNTAQLRMLSIMRQQHSLSIFPYSFSANFTTDIPDFASYWETRSSQLKNTLQRRKKRLKQQDVDIKIYDHLTEEHCRHYWYIYERSWKTQEPSHDFINWLMQWAERNGKLQLGILSINGCVAACQFWLVHAQTAYIYKLAQDKAMDDYSPGTILTEHLIRTLSEQQGIKHLDFLLGDDDFKTLWMANRNDIWGVEIINSSLIRGRILARLYVIRDVIKNRIGINFKRLSQWPKTLLNMLKREPK